MVLRTKLLKLSTVVLFLFTISNSYGQAIDHTDQGGNDNIENLTDSERHIRDNYIDQGQSERMKKELCEADDDSRKACQGLKAQKKFMGMSPTLIQGVAKAYTMIISMSDIGGGFVTEAGQAKKDAEAEKPDAAETNETTAEGEEAPEGEEEEANDYCKYIATATETVAMFQQQTDQDTISKVPVKKESAQKEALYKAEQSHRSRADNAKIQRTGWLATTGCYTAYMASGFQGVSRKSWSNWLKLGASALLYKFFDSQVGAHEDYADKVNDIAKQLPGKGDCNPITERNCYCAQKENQYDPKYCKDVINQRKIAETSVAVSCIDDKMKADPSCKCAATKTCYDQKFLTNVKGLNFDAALAKNAISPFKSLVNGEHLGAKLSNNSAKQFAVANQALKNSSKGLGGLSKPLNNAQKSEAKALIDAFGIDKKLAAHIAAQPVNPAVKKAISKLSNGAKGNSRYASKRSYSRNNKRSKVLTFGGGGGINQRKKKSRSNDDFFKGLE